MKENVNIDELLNAFLDDELTRRQLAEVQRMLSHDRQVAQRLSELEKCRMLVNSLPIAEAPADILENVKASLETQTPLDTQPEYSDQGRGARQLMMRKVLSAAAIVALVTVLGGVIYNIVAVFIDRIEIMIMRAYIDSSIRSDSWAGWHDITGFETPEQMFII